MIVRVRCPNPDCGKRYKIEDSLLGQTTACNKCGRVFLLSGPGGQAIEAHGQTEIQHGAAPKTPGGVPEQLGRFLIRSRLGAGAFGTVYRALDPVLGREVALKVPRAAALEKPEARARFLREPKAAAQLRHPNIVPIYDAGTDGEHYYIASAFIEGRTLAESLQSDRPDFPRAAEIVRRLAEALNYAHQNGVVHRDVKPANVMLDARSEPLLMDFGLARLDSSEEKLTQDGTLMGTPAYMAPEQADSSRGDVGPASDQYGLAVVLYELLTGQTPFSGPTAVLIFNVVNQDPPLPRSLTPGIPRDLETICLKAMAKRAEDRYADCGSFAEDLRRWLADEPIRARRLGLAERWARWCRRNPALAIVSATASLLLIAVALVATAGYFRELNLREQTESALATARTAERQAATSAAEAERQRQAAVQQRDAAEAARLREAASAQEADRQRLIAQEESDAAREAQRRESNAKEEADEQRQIAERERAEAEKVRKEAVDNLYLLRIAFALQHLYAKNVPLAREHLEACPPEQRGWEWEHLQWRCTNDPVSITAHSGSVYCAVFSPDGKQIATASADKTIRLWNAIDGQRLRQLPEQAASVGSVAFSPDGRRLAAAVYDGSIHVWDLAGDEEEEEIVFQAHGAGVCRVAFSPDGKYLASGGGDQVLKLWSAADGREVRQYDGVAAAVRGLAFSPDGKWIAAAGMIWPVEETQGQAFRTTAKEFYSVAFSPDGKRVAWGTGRRQHGGPSGRGETDVVLCDLATRKESARLRGHTEQVNSVVFGPDGSRIVSGSADGTVKFWNAATGQEVMTLRDHQRTVDCVAFSPAGRRMVTTGYGGNLRILDTRSKVFMVGVSTSGDEVFRFSPDSKRITVVSRSGTIRIWDLQSGSAVHLVNKRVPSSGAPALNVDGSRVAYTTSNKSVVVWDIATEQPVFSGPAYTTNADNRWIQLQFTPDGKRVASKCCRPHRSKGYEYEFVIWDVSSGKALFSTGDQTARRPPTVAFSPDGRQFAFWSGNHGPFALYDVETGRRLAKSLMNGPATSPVFSPDGKYLATGTLVFRVGAGGETISLMLELPANNGYPAFSPDGERLAVSTPKGILLLETDSWTEVLTIPATSYGTLKPAAFSPDGKLLAAFQYDNDMINLYDTTGGQKMFQLSGRPQSPTGVAFSPDGNWIVLSVRQYGTIVWGIGDERPPVSVMAAAPEDGEIEHPPPSANSE